MALPISKASSKHYSNPQDKLKRFGDCVVPLNVTSQHGRLKRLELGNCRNVQFAVDDLKVSSASAGIARLTFRGLGDFRVNPEKSLSFKIDLFKSSN